MPDPRRQDSPPSRPTAPPRAPGEGDDHRAAPATLQEFEVSDPEEFRSRSPSGVQHQMVVRGRGPFRAWRRRLASPGMIVSRGRTSLGVTHRTGTGDYAFFTLVEDGAPPSVMNGLAFPAGTIAWCRAGAEVLSQSPPDGTWWNACFPPARVEAAWSALFGVPPPPPRTVVRVAPIPPPRRAEILAGMAAALSIAEASDGPTLPDGLLRLALEPFAPATGDASPEDGSGTAARRLAVIEALVTLADESDEPRSLVEVCARIGVPLRSLNAFSNAVLGMSAGAYLRRRRLHAVLADLRAGTAASVTEAATRRGFWELGRFAADYRALFGEAPSATLRRSRTGAG